MWKRSWRLAALALVFATVFYYSGYCQAAEVYYFKMNDGKTYVGEVLPSDTTVFKIRQKNGDIIDLPFDEVTETGEYTAQDHATTAVASDTTGRGNGAGGTGGLGAAFELGLMYFHVDYKEDLSSGKSEESGWLPGAYVGLSRVSPGEVYYKAYLEFASDELDYDGTTWGGTPVRDISSASFWRFQFNLGYTFPVRRNLLFSPYAGYGFRYWQRGLKGASPYDEYYAWHYFPIGVSTHVILNDQWSIHPAFEARFMFAGSMTAKFNDPGYNEVGFTLGNKTGYKLEVPIRYQFSEKWAVIGAPWFSNSKIGESEIETLTYNGVPVALVQEPSSETNQYGLNLTFSYRFK